MASFTDTIRLTVSVVTGQATGSLKSLSAEVSNAEGAWGKMKAAGKGAMDFVAANAVSFGIAAGAAIAGFAAKGVDEFEKMALGAGKLRDSLGITAEEASRLQEVAGDLGIPIESVSTAINKMNKTAGSTPGVFKNLGIEIAHAKDGTYDANQTFLNVIDALHNVPDASARAAAGAQIFGKGWQSVSELVSLGADKVKKKLAEVEDQKVVGDPQIAAAREFKASLEDLKDKASDLAIEVGGSLVPALTALVKTASAIAKPFTDAHQTTVEFQKNAQDAMLDQLSDSERAKLASEQAAQAEVERAKETSSAAAVAATAYDLQETAVLKSKAATEAWGKSQEEAADQAKAILDILQKQSDAMLNDADAAIKATDAADNMTQAIVDSSKVQGDGTKTTEDKTRAVKSERDAIIENAKAQSDLTIKMADGSTRAATATEKLDTFNHTLLAGATFATPAAKDAIADYIIQANHIPESKATEIRAAIAAGDIPRANQLIDDASRNRSTTIAVDADTSRARSAIAGVINQNYGVTLGVIGTGQRRAAGGTVEAGDFYVVGEHGPEGFVPDRDGRIIPNGQLVNATGERGPELIAQA